MVIIHGFIFKSYFSVIIPFIWCKCICSYMALLFIKREEISFNTFFCFNILELVKFSCSIGSKFRLRKICRGRFEGSETQTEKIITFRMFMFLKLLLQEKIVVKREAVPLYSEKDNYHVNEAKHTACFCRCSGLSFRENPLVELVGISVTCGNASSVSWAACHQGCSPLRPLIAFELWHPERLCGTKMLNTHQSTLPCPLRSVPIKSVGTAGLWCVLPSPISRLSPASSCHTTWAHVTQYELVCIPPWSLTWVCCWFLRSGGHSPFLETAESSKY